MKAQLQPISAYTYPDVRITDKERSAMPRKTTAGFEHHKLKVHVQLPATLPGCIIIIITLTKKSSNSSSSTRVVVNQ